MIHPRHLMLLILATSGCAPSGRFTRLDAELHDRARSGTFSGAVLVDTAGTPELARAYGDGITMDTCFDLASASKMFTLVAIEQLIEAGKLHEQDRLGTYVTSYPAAADVTIGQLRSHTGGLPAGVTPDFFSAIETRHSLDEMISAVAAPLEAAPGTRKQYSNIGFLLLGRVVEVVSGESFEHYVAAHIAGPAGMQHTRAGAAGCAQRVAPPATPAGGWSSTAGDLLRFTRALRDRRLVSASVDALGLGRRAWGSNRMIGHNGGAPGMNAEVWMVNDDHTVIVLSNLDPPAATHVADEIVTILTGSSPPPMGGKVLVRRP